jgi:hypothetical protein
MPAQMGNDAMPPPFADELKPASFHWFFVSVIFLIYCCAVESAFVYVMTFFNSGSFRWWPWLIPAWRDVFLLTVLPSCLSGGQILPGVWFI